MSGLVIGLQNRAQRFESASDLRAFPSIGNAFFIISMLNMWQNLVKA